MSVLMSCHNAGRWLGAAIDSVLAQTFGDFEFLLIDDGSTDETWEIIRSRQSRDGRIVGATKENSGLTDSLNQGILKAGGNWIARLDADDLCEPTRLEEQIRFLRENPEVILLGTGFVEIDEKDRVVKRHPAVYCKQVRKLNFSGRFFPHSSVLFRRDVGQEAGFYNPRFRKSQDVDLWLRLSERGRVACLRKCLVRIRKHQEQISSSVSGTSQLVYGTAALVCHFLRARGCQDPSASGNESAWDDFIGWLDTRLSDEGEFEKLHAWADARAAYFSAGNRMTAVIRFGSRLAGSRHAGALILEKLFGSSLPQRLALEHIERMDRKPSGKAR